MDNATRLITQLVRAGYSCNVMHNHDSQGAPFLSVEAVKELAPVRGVSDTDHVYATWYTRGTGTYRLHTALLNQRDVTLKNLSEHVKDQNDEPQ